MISIIHHLASLYTHVHVHVASSQPPSKRLRTAICVCSMCDGAERDHRTVDRHMEEVYLAQAHTSESEFSDDPTHPPSESEFSDDPTHSPDFYLDDDGSTQDERTSSDVQGSSNMTSFEQCENQPVISQTKIQQFIMSEVRLKLNHGLSVSTAEDHLKIQLLCLVAKLYQQSGMMSSV